MEENKGKGRKIKKALDEVLQMIELIVEYLTFRQKSAINSSPLLLNSIKATKEHLIDQPRRLFNICFGMLNRRVKPLIVESLVNVPFLTTDLDHKM